MNLHHDIEALLEAGIIDSATADRIVNYYQSKPSNSGNRLYLAFGILGALLIGSGIILILAHNWDDFSRVTKTVLAFLPLLISQVLCAYTLLKKRESDTWREATAILLFFAVGASIALISQIYNLPGRLDSYLLTWAVLVLPLIYIMRSSMVSLLYLAGITWYACEAGYGYNGTPWNYYWLLFLAAVPFYYLEYRRRPQSNAVAFHHWMIPGSLVIALGILSDTHGEWMFVTYMSLLGLFYQIGNSTYLKNESLAKNGYRVIGALGSIGVLLALSFDWFWEELSRDGDLWSGLGTSPEFWLSLILTALATGLSVRNLSRKGWKNIEPLTPVFLIFLVIFLIGTQSEIAVILINILVLTAGILIIRKGGQEDHLGVLNFGLLVVTALIGARFFDVNLSFVLRGLLFILLGIGFFVVNYRMLQKRKAHEN
jgi:uncharacterized membrane protein